MPNFVSVATSVAELAHGEKSRTHSLTQSLVPAIDIWHVKLRVIVVVVVTHSPSLFDAPRTEAFASE